MMTTLPYWPTAPVSRSLRMENCHDRSFCLSRLFARALVLRLRSDGGIVMSINIRVAGISDPQLIGEGTRSRRLLLRESYSRSSRFAFFALDSKSEIIAAGNIRIEERERVRREAIARQARTGQLRRR